MGLLLSIKAFIFYIKCLLYFNVNTKYFLYITSVLHFNVRYTEYIFSSKEIKVLGFDWLYLISNIQVQY